MRDIRLLQPCGARANARSVAAWLQALALALTVVGVGVTVAEAGSMETLREAMAAAYRTNPQLDAERARQRATDEEVSRAHAGYRPTINATATTTFQHTNTRPPSASEGSIYPKSIGANLTQNLFDGFRTSSAILVAEATVRSGRETLRSVEQQVLLAAVQAYADVVRDQAIVRLRENNVTVLSRELKATRDRFAVGEVTKTDVAQAEARRAGAVSALDLARANLKTSRATYERVIGHPPGALSPPQPASRRMPSSLNQAIDIAMRETPTVIAALYIEEAARYTVDQIRATLLPQVDLRASYTATRDPSKTLDLSEVTTVTGTLTVPLYEGGGVQAQVRQAKQTHIQRLQQVEQARTEARATVVNAWSQLAAARAAVQSDAAQVRASQTALSGVREEEKVGQRTLLDVLNAEQELLNAQVTQVTDQRNLVLASYTVLSAVGRLSSQDLALTAKVYDPDVHYHEVRRKWWGISITHRDGRRESRNLWESHGRHEAYK
ncbi:MAG: TolC family outer membrane protein [Hyphomicrobiaceae bacterium]